MPKYRFTRYFDNEVMRKRPYLRKEWCIRVVESLELEHRWIGSRFFDNVSDVMQQILV